MAGPDAATASTAPRGASMPLRFDRSNIAVVIPALNEALRIREVVTDALAYCDRVIVIDDGSDDDTAAQIADLPVTLLKHGRRMGKGASLRDGFAEAARQDAKGVVTMDGDGQHRASDIPCMLAAANRHAGCVIIGSRLRKRASQPLYRRIGNDFGDWGLAWACGFRMIDSQSGQRFYPRNVFMLRDVEGEGFVFEAQMLVSAARRANARVVSVPIETRYASADQAFRASHFRLFRDLWKITSHLVVQVWRHGHILREYRLARSRLPVIHDGDGAHDPHDALS